MPHFCYLCVRAPKVKEDLDDVVENEEPIKYFKKNKCGKRYKIDFILENMLQ